MFTKSLSRQPGEPVEHACVIVLGDIGRSPRMQYHIKSLSASCYLVDVIGYVESMPLEELIGNSNIKIHPLVLFPDLNLPSTLRYLFKALWQTLTLLIALLSITKPKFILCQNPPAIPTLAVTYMYCLYARAKLIVDWHNYTHTILAISSKPNALLVKFARTIEGYFGRKASYNLCVTQAMQIDLKENWNISATVVYDRPPTQFHPISLDEKHELFLHLSNNLKEFRPDNREFKKDESAFTLRTSNGKVEYKTNRPALLISSTSWTPDEDFSILMSALEMYEAKASSEPTHYPQLLCVITGKGPLKDYYKKELDTKTWNRVKVVTPWLENADYPKILAAADLGVCLHFSSSGLDLPMKVVDMFGSGLPVCAKKFKCINELVKHGQNGFLFESYEELFVQICEWLYDFPSNIAMINQKEIINQNLKKFQQVRWDENWKQTVKPILQRL